MCVCLQCVLWCYAGVCHCNSHKRSNFWNNRRNCALLGGLKTFNLTLSETDAHLRNAGTSSGTCGYGYEIWMWKYSFWTTCCVIVIQSVCVHCHRSFVFPLSRWVVAELQKRARFILRSLHEGEGGGGIRSEHTKPARPHLRVSVTSFRWPSYTFLLSDSLCNQKY